MTSAPARTNVYIDGFNLYYGALKGSAHKWLDIEAMCRKLLPSPQFELQRVRYFTARIAARPNDLQGPVRQDTYLRALAVTQPLLSVHYGNFKTRPVRMALANPPVGGPKTVEVMKTEEKGSDVNLATYLLVDAFRSDADCYVVISNDSDLVEPIRIVRHEVGAAVGIVNPGKAHHRSIELVNTQPTFLKQIREGVVRSSQLPAQLTDHLGVVAKPSEW